MRATRCLRSERGATLVLMAITILLALGMGAMAIDYGMLKSAKAEAQRAMDSAALAGASAFLEFDPSVDKVPIAEARAHELANTHVVRTVPITDPEVVVEVDVVKETVKATWTRNSLGLWFGRIFGANTMGLMATATAQAAISGKSDCLKPVALPDIWNNVNNTGLDGKKSYTEDANGDHLWDYTDKDGDGYVSPGEMEKWQFNTGDIYDPLTNGYGTTFRNQYGSGDQAKTKDYGRPVFVQAFDANKDAIVSSYMQTWADANNTRGADSMKAAIMGRRCQSAEVGTQYRQGQGSVTSLEPSWDSLIAMDPGAHWVDGTTNDVVGSMYGADWLEKSPRVMIVGLYDPHQIPTGPSDNPIQFTNFAKLWLDQRPCSSITGGLGKCKWPIMGRFLGYVQGGSGGPVNGSLIKQLVLIK